MFALQLFGQMLPLVIFIIVDSVCSNIRISILSAIVFACGQIGFYYVKTGRFDWFVLLDVGLISAMGILSIVSRNDLFFKVKPAIIEGAAIVFMLVLFFSSDRFLLDYFGRLTPKGMTLNPALIGSMKIMLLWGCIYMIFHIGAVLYTAYYSSRKMWAFISGPGFYLLFIPVMVIILLKKSKRKYKAFK